MPGSLPTLSTPRLAQGGWADDDVPELGTSPRSPASFVSLSAPLTPPQASAPRDKAALARSASAHERTLGPLTLQRAIGTGAFSRTYRAAGLGHVFAVKSRLPSTDPRVFAHEREVLQKLGRHDGVVRLYPDLSDADHLVLDLYDGDLRRLVQRRASERAAGQTDIFDFARLREPVVGGARWREYAEQLTAALEYVHSRNVVHADLKPENVLCAGDVLVLADFSAAVDLDAQPASVLPAELGPGFALSPVYADPRVRAGLCLPSCQSDVYALGLVLAFCATGEEPYAGARSAPQRLLWMDKIAPIDSYDADAQQRLAAVRPVVDAFLSRSLPAARAALAALPRE